MHQSQNGESATPSSQLLGCTPAPTEWLAQQHEAQRRSDARAKLGYLVCVAKIPSDPAWSEMDADQLEAELRRLGNRAEPRVPTL